MRTDADRKTYRDRGGRYPSDLTDAQLGTVAPLLTGDAGGAAEAWASGRTQDGDPGLARRVVSGPQAEVRGTDGEKKVPSTGSG